MPRTPTHKAVILARGLGTRMQRADEAAGLDSSQAAAADTGVKALIPIGRPFLDYVLSALADGGYDRVCLVIGPEHQAVRHYYGQQVRPARLNVEFAVQQQPRGTADAVAAAESFAGSDPILVLNSDNYYPAEALASLRNQPGSAVALFEWQSLVNRGNVPEERLRRFAVGQMDSDGHLAGILEKPDEKTWNALPRPIWLSMNCWRFRPVIFEACRKIRPSPRGELELPDAVQYAMERLNEPFRVIKVEDAVLDLTSRSDIAAVAARLKDVEVRL